MTWEAWPNWNRRRPATPVVRIIKWPSGWAWSVTLRGIRLGAGQTWTRFGARWAAWRCVRMERNP